MKKLIVSMALLALVFGFSRCTQPDASQALGEQNKAVVDRFIQAYLKGDFETMAALMGDQCKLMGPAMKDSVNKEQFLEGWKKDFKQYAYKRVVAVPIHVDEGVAKGDWVGEWGDFSIPPDKGLSAATFRFHAVYKVVDGKIVFAIAYYDVADILAQREFTFVPPVSSQGTPTK